MAAHEIRQLFREKRLFHIPKRIRLITEHTSNIILHNPPRSLEIYMAIHNPTQGKNLPMERMQQRPRNYGKSTPPRDRTFPDLPPVQTGSRNTRTHAPPLLLDSQGLEVCPSASTNIQTGTHSLGRVDLQHKPKPSHLG